jgi:hypothetical protein
MTRTTKARLDAADMKRIARLRERIATLEKARQAATLEIRALNERMRRRLNRTKWNAPSNPMPAAKQVWRYLFPGEPWPTGWSVKWAGFMRNVHGLTLYGRKEILLCHADCARGMYPVVALLAHEFVHMRSGPDLRHGADFRRIESSLCARLGLRPVADD